MSEGMMTRLFAEMDEIAHALRTKPHQISDDDQIAFRQSQKRRHPDLTKEQWLALFAVWGEHDKARQEAEQAATRARIWEERRNLFVQRAFMPQDAERLRAIDARLAEIARMIGFQ
jgi:hypothetical protein